MTHTQLSTAGKAFSMIGVIVIAALLYFAIAAILFGAINQG